eukprot:810556-Prymnesium_polylepis.1
MREVQTPGCGGTNVSSGGVGGAGEERAGLEGRGDAVFDGGGEQLVHMACGRVVGPRVKQRVEDGPAAADGGAVGGGGPRGAQGDGSGDGGVVDKGGDVERGGVKEGRRRGDVDTRSSTLRYVLVLYEIQLYSCSA